MKKMRLDDLKNITFEEGCNKYLDDCRARNLREGTINHYKPFSIRLNGTIKYNTSNKRDTAETVPLFSIELSLFY